VGKRGSFEKESGDSEGEMQAGGMMYGSCCVTMDDDTTEQENGRIGAAWKN